MLKKYLIPPSASKTLPGALEVQMWQKTQRDQDNEAPAGKRLRDNLVDLYAGGDIPGDRAQSLLEDAGAFAEELGRHELQDLRAHKWPGSARNVNRDL